MPDQGRRGGGNRAGGRPLPPPAARRPAVLAELPAGASATVRALRGGRRAACRLLTLGFTPGTEVTVLQNRGRGAMIVLVFGVRVALGRGEAEKIEIERG